MNNSNVREAVVFENIPAYATENGTVGREMNLGPGLGDDKWTSTDEDSYMKVIAGSTEEEFDRYCLTLGGIFELLLSREERNGKYRAYKTTDMILFVSFDRTDSTVRVVEDKTSCGIGDTGDTKGNADGVILYQYSLNYVGSAVEYAEPGCMDCGMMYIIKLADNSLFLIDSGHGYQTTARSLTALYEFMKNVSGTEEGKKIPIKAWFFTHAHGDHCGMAAAFLGQKYPMIENLELPDFSDKVEIEKVMFNFPSYCVIRRNFAADETFAIRKALREKFPEVKYYKLHTGERFDFPGASFDVLYTLEDAVDVTGKWPFRDFNSSSTVLRMHSGGKNLMFLADISAAAEKIILRRYNEDELKSDVVQIAHHCINNLDIYDSIKAPVALVSTSLGRIKERLWDNYLRFEKYAVDGCLFEDEVTWKIDFGKDKLPAEALPRYDKQ